MKLFRAIETALWRVSRGDRGNIYRVGAEWMTTSSNRDEVQKLYPHNRVAEFQTYESFLANYNFEESTRGSVFHPLGTGGSND